MMNRRQFLALGAAGLAAAGLPLAAQAKTDARVVVIGGGVGGATFAKYIRMMDSSVQVTVIERNPVYIRPYGSSEVLNGHVDMDDLEVTYDALREKYGVNFIFDSAIDFDADKRYVLLQSGERVPYDRLVVSPGIELLYDRIDGYSQDIADTLVPSGWIPGQQTALLRDQLMSMRQGGTFVMVAPPAPYRCPPGPYERSALVAEWCQVHNPTAKVIILDPKNKFVTDQSMMLGWNRRHGFNIPQDFMEGMPDDVKHHDSGMLEWVPQREGGQILSLDAKNKVVKAEAGTFKADVINIVPPMRGGVIAQKMGLTNDKGWAPVNHRTFESTIHPNVHVLGDTSISNMPKSGYAANSQAKAVARAILDLMAGQPVGEPSFANTCYAVAAKDYGLFVADVFKLNEEGRIKRQPGPRYLPLDASPAQLRAGAVYQQTWLKAFTEDSFA